MYWTLICRYPATQNYSELVQNYAYLFHNYFQLYTLLVSTAPASQTPDLLLIGFNFLSLRRR